jgi:zinc-ribbon domain
MHCPNCGSEAPMEQKFCRSCGFGLGKVARLIAEQASDENLDLASDPGEEPSKRFRPVWFLFFIIMFLTFSFYFTAPGSGWGFVSAVIIALLLGMLPIWTYTEFGRKRLGEQKPPRPASSTNAPTTKKLRPQPGPEMNASVTEQTTANLADIADDKKLLPHPDLETNASVTEHTTAKQAEKIEN